MACRCNNCKMMRERPTRPESLIPSGEAVFKVKGGVIRPAGIDAAVHIMEDFQNRSMPKFDFDPDLFETYVLASVNAEYFLAGGSINVWCLLNEYTRELTGSPCGSWHWYPLDTYARGGHSREARLKNLKACCKVWSRFYLDRVDSLGAKNFNSSSLVRSLGDAWTTKEGKFMTRLSNELYKKHGVKLSPQKAESLGNILSQYVIKPGEYKFTFDQDFVSGRPEDYCHRDSCWWGGYASSRELLASNGGYGLRMWEKDTPVARCWIAPANDGLLIFNAYGKLQLTDFAGILAEQWGLAAQSCSISYPSEIYINCGSGIHLRKWSASTLVDISDWANGKAYSWRPPQHSCPVCGEEQDEDVVCEDCLAGDLSETSIEELVEA